MIEVFAMNAMLADVELISACDVQITDFPYSPHVHNSATSNNTDEMGVTKRDLGFEPLSDDFRNFGALVASTISRWTVLFTDLESTHLWRDAMAAQGVEYVREIPHVPDTPNDSEPDKLPHYWVRWSQPQMSGDRAPQASEAVLTFHPMKDVGKRKTVWKPTKKHWNGNGGHTAYTERALRGKHKYPAEKPLDLMLSIVAAYSDPGEAVIDLACGVGTTILACRLLDRDGIGFEEIERVARIANRRVQPREPLSGRDRVRALEWCDRWEAEASAVPVPTKPSQKRTYERAQRRLADVERVRSKL